MTEARDMHINYHITFLFKLTDLIGAIDSEMFKVLLTRL